MEELHEVDVRRVLAEVLFQEPVDRCLEQESVVDRNEPDALVAEPAGLTATCDARVHEVVRDEEERLQLFQSVSEVHMSDADMYTHELDTPAQHGGLEVLIIGQRPALEDRDGVHDGQAAVELASGDVVVEVLQNENEMSTRRRADGTEDGGARGGTSRRRLWACPAP